MPKLVIDLAEMRKLSEAELNDLAKTVAETLVQNKKEQEEKIRRKKEYTLRIPEDTYTFLYSSFHERVMKLGESDPELMAKLQEIEKQCKIKNPHKKEKIYPCPECGEMCLRLGIFGDSDFEPQYRVMCDNCSFVAPVEETESQYDAWEDFHAWLEKEGYLNSKEG